MQFIICPKCGTKFNPQTVPCCPICKIQQWNSDYNARYGNKDRPKYQPLIGTEKTKIKTVINLKTNYKFGIKYISHRIHRSQESIKELVDKLLNDIGF